MNNVDASDFELMIESIEKVSEFANTYLTADMAKKAVTIKLPSLEDFNSESLSESVIWRARFVQLAGFDKQRRISNKTETLGEVDLSQSQITVLFTSVIEGEPGAATPGTTVWVVDVDSVNPNHFSLWKNLS